MELEINRLKFIINQMRKKGVCGCVIVNPSNQCYSSSSASESGSAESQAVKTKKPQTQVRKAERGAGLRKNYASSVNLLENDSGKALV